MISRTLLAKGDAAYSYRISGCSGLGASCNTELESRMRNGPSARAYLPSSSGAKMVSIFHPKTNAPVASRTAKAAELFKTLGRSEERVRVRGLGSGITKSFGTSTFGGAADDGDAAFPSKPSKKENPLTGCIAASCARQSNVIADFIFRWSPRRRRKNDACCKGVATSFLDEAELSRISHISTGVVTRASFRN